VTTDIAQPPLGSATKPDTTNDLKSLPMHEVEKKLDTSPDGLTTAEAAKRLAQYGPNEIAEHKTNPLLKFLSGQRNSWFHRRTPSGQRHRSAQGETCDQRPGQT
jgi:magnesium-transporting ATPase (P-type)